MNLIFSGIKQKMLDVFAKMRECGKDGWLTPMQFINISHSVLSLDAHDQSEVPHPSASHGTYAHASSLETMLHLHTEM